MTPNIPFQPHADAGPAAAFGSLPAASVIAECLRVHRETPPRSKVARFFGRSPLSELSRPWYVGALGELDVARRIERLGAEWTVLHSVPIGTRGSDIDHIVIGSAGVFTVNTKHHEDARVWVGSRRLLVNGQATDHLRNARYEAGRVEKLLSAATGGAVPVSALVVIVGAREITVRERPAGVTVLRSTELARWLSRQKPRLDPDRRTAITGAASARETWTVEPETSSDVAGFEPLRREVVAAGRVRMLWGAAVLVALIGTAAPYAINLASRALGG